MKRRGGLRRIYPLPLRRAGPGRSSFQFSFFFCRPSSFLFISTILCLLSDIMKFTSTLALAAAFVAVTHAAPASVTPRASAAKKGLGFNDITATTAFGNQCVALVLFYYMILMTFQSLLGLQLGLVTPTCARFRRAVRSPALLECSGPHGTVGGQRQRCTCVWFGSHSWVRHPTASILN